MERVISRQLASPYGQELTAEELDLVAGGAAADCMTEAGPTQLEGGGQVKDPRRLDCA